MKYLDKKTLDNRNYGIDLLRIIAMFFVVILHSLGHGGLLYNTVIGSYQYKFVWLLEIFAYCAVNIFALISGYISYTDKEKKMNYTNYIMLWLQVVFYGVVISIILNLINTSYVERIDFLNAFFPVTKKMYWYFTAYTGLFVIMPIINNGIRNCDNKNLKKLFIIIFIVFTFSEIISPKFILNGGYSFIWITIMYILGLILKKTQIGNNIKKYQIIIGIILLYIITYLYKIYGLEISRFGINITKDILISYTSPTILGIAILYVILFSRIKLNNLFIKIIKFAAPSTFSIYLINDNDLIRRNIITNLFSNLIDNSIIDIFITIVGFSLLFVIVSIFIDKIRIFLFKKFRIREIVDKIIYFFNALLDKVVS